SERDAAGLRRIVPHDGLRLLRLVGHARTGLGGVVLLRETEHRCTSLTSADTRRRSERRSALLTPCFASVTVSGSVSPPGTVGANESACKPDSVPAVRRWATIHLGRALLHASVRPTRCFGRAVLQRNAGASSWSCS